MLKKIALLTLFIVATVAVAQDKTVGPGNAVYRLDFTVLETDGAKKISSKNYSVTVRDDRRGRMRVGSRVPIQSGKEGGWQYFDVGVNIDAGANWVDAS